MTLLPCARPRPSRSPARLRTAVWHGLLPWLALAACASPSDPDPLALRDAAWPDASPTSLSLGESTTCVTTDDGLAKCWGRGDGGRLGLGTPVVESMPDPPTLEPLALGGLAEQVATSGAQSFVLLDDGSVRAFGQNHANALGVPHTETVAHVPTQVALAGAAVQVAAGDGFACARLQDGRVQCWGASDEGQLGRGGPTSSRLPGDVVLGRSAAEIAVGAAHACARSPEGAVRCWGRGDAGQLGYGHALPIGDHETPAAAGDVALGGVAVELAAGGAHTCARLAHGAVRCWGDNAEGQLGYGHTQPIGDDETPADAGDVALGGAAIQVVAGLRHTCALLEGGKLRCWGDGSSAQLGLALALRVGDDEHPFEVAAVDTGEPEVKAIFAGALAEHTCALWSGGQLRCWGRNDHGQLGLGFTSPADPVEGPPGDLPDVIIVEDPDA